MNVACTDVVENTSLAVSQRKVSRALAGHTLREE